MVPCSVRELHYLDFPMSHRDRQPSRHFELSSLSGITCRNGGILNSKSGESSLYCVLAAVRHHGCLIIAIRAVAQLWQTSPIPHRRGRGTITTTGAFVGIFAANKLRLNRARSLIRNFVDRVEVDRVEVDRAARKSIGCGLSSSLVGLRRT